MAEGVGFEPTVQFVMFFEVRPRCVTLLAGLGGFHWTK